LPEDFHEKVGVRQPDERREFGAELTSKERVLCGSQELRSAASSFEASTHCAGKLITHCMA
jgi:hypothetical protein